MSEREMPRAVVLAQMKSETRTLHCSVESIPGSAFNLREVNFKIDTAPAWQGHFLAVKK